MTVVAPQGREPASSHEEVDGVLVERFTYFLPRRLQRLCYGSGIPTNIRRCRLLVLQIPFLLWGFLRRGLAVSRDCDLIHAHWSLAGVAGLIISRLRGVPLVLTIYGAEIFSLQGALPVRFAVNRADFVTTISRYTLSKISAVAHPRAVAVIPFGVNAEKCAPVDPSISARLREQLGIPRERLVVLTVGRLVERKGVQYLIEAMPLILQAVDAHLVVAGSGPLHDQLSVRATQLGVKDHVTFTGLIPDDLLTALYKMAAVFVLPSIVDHTGDTEGLGVVLLEAMANGAPVVASRVGGITDVVVDGVSGYLVEPADSERLAEKLIAVLQHPEARMALGQQGQQWVQERFSWDRIASQTLQVYEQVLIDQRCKSTKVHGL